MVTLEASVSGLARTLACDWMARLVAMDTLWTPERALRAPEPGRARCNVENTLLSAQISNCKELSKPSESEKDQIINKKYQRKFFISFPLSLDVNGT